MTLLSINFGIIFYYSTPTVLADKECIPSVTPDVKGNGGDFMLLDPDCPGQEAREIDPQVPWYVTDRPVTLPTPGNPPPPGGAPGSPPGGGGVNPVEGACSGFIPVDTGLYAEQYSYAEGITGIPAEMLNALHYIETTYGPTAQGANPFQITRGPQTPGFCENNCGNPDCSEPIGGTCYPYIPTGPHVDETTSPDTGIGLFALGAALFLLDIKDFDVGRSGDLAYIAERIIAYNGVPAERDVPNPPNQYGCDCAGNKYTEVWKDVFPGDWNVKRSYPYGFFGIEECYCDYFIHVCSTGACYVEHYNHYGAFTAYLLLTGQSDPC